MRRVRYPAGTWATEVCALENLWRDRADACRARAVHAALGGRLPHDVVRLVVAHGALRACDARAAGGDGAFEVRLRARGTLEG